MYVTHSMCMYTGNPPYTLEPAATLDAAPSRAM